MSRKKKVAPEQPADSQPTAGFSPPPPQEPRASLSVDIEEMFNLTAKLPDAELVQLPAGDLRQLLDALVYLSSFKLATAKALVAASQEAVQGLDSIVERLRGGA